MFRKPVNLTDPGVKSRFRFAVREDPGWRRLPQRERRSLFRDPATMPLLTRITDALNAQGYSVTSPRTGKACHGWFQAEFATTRIMVALLVRRRRGMIACELLTWPSPSFRQQWLSRSSASLDSSQWNQLCVAIYEVLREKIKPESDER
jgi:hypothetical protein